MAGFTGANRERSRHRASTTIRPSASPTWISKGVDVNLTLPSGWFGTWTAGDDVALEMAMYRAYHRWMEDYCGAFPERLGGIILVCARDVAGSLEEIKRWAQVALGLGGDGLRAGTACRSTIPTSSRSGPRPPEHDLAVVLHTFTVMPPYAPGGARHLGEPVPAALGGAPLVRHAQHGGADRQRRDGPLPAACASARSKPGTAGCRSGWRASTSTPTPSRRHCPSSAHKPSEYVLGGRYFQSIEMPEGEQLTNAVIDLLGEDVLMYASDYPHGES